MRLTHVCVTNYKSVIDSDEFSVGDQTCLVGKNEAGKSALLEALYKLKPIHKSESSFKETEFPRSDLRTLRDRDAKSPKALCTKWELSSDDLQSVESSLGAQPITSNNIVISKNYENNTLWIVKYKENVVVNNLRSSANLDATELSPLKKAGSVTDLITILENLESRSEKQAQLLGKLTELFPDKELGAKIYKLLTDRIPTILYFRNYDQLPGLISLNEIKVKIENDDLDFGDHIFLSLLELARSSIEEIESIGNLEQQIMEFEAVSNTLTKVIFKYWSQNKHLDVKFNIDQAKSNDAPPFNAGMVFSTRIYNNRHKASVNFDERSSGFIWFFSFLIWFYQIKENYGDNLLILLDEPGLSLHAKAQADLIEYFNKELIPNYQLIYTAHSPFMIDPENLLSVRTVEDVVVDDEIIGTKVGDKILSTDPDTVLPLYGALGFEITQTLFVGANTLLVEGPSDLLYLKFFSNELQKNEKTSLDPRWTISPSGGLDKVMSFVTLFWPRVRRIAIVADYHKGDKNKLERMRESELLEANHVLTMDTYTGKEEADIEDLIGRDAYVALVNKCYDLKGTKKLPKNKPDSSNDLVVKEVTEHFNTKSTDGPEFDHFKPSTYLTENPTLMESLPDMEATLARFESLFSDLNKLLI